MVSRTEILNMANTIVSHDRNDNYGPPENNFHTISIFWTAYLRSRLLLDPADELCSKDVAAMMALMKVSRIASGKEKTDNWVDLAGYAACGGEVESREAEKEEK